MTTTTDRTEVVMRSRWANGLAAVCAVLAVQTLLLSQAGPVFRALWHSDVRAVGRVVDRLNGQLAITQLEPMHDYLSVIDRAVTVGGIAHLHPVTEDEVRMSAGRFMVTALARGLRFEDLRQQLDGLVFPSAPALIAEPDAAQQTGIVLGHRLAEALHVKIGDRIVLQSTAAAGAGQDRSHIVTGIFTSRSLDHDKMLAYLPLAAAQSQFNKTGLIDQLRVYVDRPTAPRGVADGLMTALGSNFHVVEIPPYDDAARRMEGHVDGFVLALSYVSTFSGLLTACFGAALALLWAMRALDRRPIV